MGHKVNPISFRLAVNHNWKSRWFAKPREFAANLLEDSLIRRLILKKMGPQAGISDIIIERSVGRLSISVSTARPGVLIGRGGKQLEALRELLTAKIAKKFKFDIVEIKKADLDPRVVAQTIGLQISKRMSFRRVGKQALQRIMSSGAKGAKIIISGRLDGAEIARRETFSEGQIPLSTLRSEVDFATYHAPTTYGTVGIKVWINR